jgi:hypothetical protein
MSRAKDCGRQCRKNGVDYKKGFIGRDELEAVNKET